MCKFTIETKPFADALSAAMSFTIKTVNLISTYSMVYLSSDDDKLKIRTCNANSSFECNMPCDTIAAGSLLVSAEKLCGILANITSENVTIERDDSKISVKPSTGKKTTVKMACIDANDFPQADTDIDSLYESVPSFALSEAISHVVFATAKDSARPFLAAVRLEQEITEEGADLYVVATNGVMLAMDRIHLDAPLENFENSNVPAGFATKMATLLKKNDCKMCIKNGKIYVKCGSIKIDSSLIVGSYPNWKRVCPDETGASVITVDGNDFASTLSLVSVMVDNASKHTWLTISPNTLAVRGFTTQYGEAEQEIEAETELSDSDDDLEVKLNEQYLQTIVSTLKGTKITMYHKPAAPLVFRTDGYANLYYCLMFAHK